MEYSDHGSTGSSNRSFGTGHRGSMSAPNRAPYRDDPSSSNAPVWSSTTTNNNNNNNTTATENFTDEDHFSYSPVTIPNRTAATAGTGTGNTIVGSFRPALEDMVDVNVSMHGKGAFQVESGSGDGLFRSSRNKTSARRSSILGVGFDELGLETVGMKRRTMMAGAVCGLLVGLSILVGVMMSNMGSNDGSSSNNKGSLSNPGSTTSDVPRHENPWVDETLTPNDCDFTGILEPDPLLQCRCNGRISTFSEKSLRQYDTLRDDLIVKHILPLFHHKLDDCHPANAALAWLATDEYPNAHDLHDRYLLAVVYASFRGFSWTTQDKWLLTSTSHCQWHGVTCNSHNRTTELVLNDNNLEGELPSEIVKLDTLTTLSLMDNRLDGRLPREWGAWRSLEVLRLSGNQLFFTIPTELGLLEHLKALELDHNQLKGRIPTELMRLPDLEYVGLWNNQLTGTIPSEIGQLTKCREFKISSNKLTGTLPTQIGNMSLLRVWESAHVLGDGAVPSEMGSMTDLVLFDVAGMGLVGTIPTEFANLVSMETLSLADNYLGGPFPTTFGAMTALQNLLVNNNAFEDSLPSELSGLRDLQQLLVHNNNLKGSIPSQLSMCTSLTTVNLSGNKNVQGKMPDTVCDLRQKALISLVADCDHDGKVQCAVPECCTSCSRDDTN